MLKGRTACELNLFVFATDKARRASFAIAHGASP